MTSQTIFLAKKTAEKEKGGGWSAPFIYVDIKSS